MSSDDLVSRGQYGPSPLGTTLFVSLRIFDGFILQRMLQLPPCNPAPYLSAKLGVSVPPPPPTGGLPVTFLGQVTTPVQAVLWAMNIAMVTKHVIWALYISKEVITPKLAITVNVFNAVFGALSTLALQFASVNPTWTEQGFKASITWFVIGVVVELVSELQRKWFKDQAKNKGKPYSGGLFGFARSVNYFGYTIARSAMATAGGGWGLGLAVGAFFTYDFLMRAIPSMDKYCTKRYGAQWEEVKNKVPYVFVPFVY